MSAPTFVASYSTPYNTTTTPNKTVTVTTQPGDIIVIYGGSEDGNYSLGTPSGNGLTYTLRQSIVSSGFCGAYIWTAVDNTGGSNWTMTFSISAGIQWGATCYVFRGSDGIGASNKSSSNGSTQTVDVTTTQDNSALVVFQGDWNAVDGSTRTWATINSITPTNGNGLERDYNFSSGKYTVYGGYYSDVGTAGSKIGGVTAPTGQNYTTLAVEVKGNTSTAPTVSSDSITNINSTAADGNGTVSSDGGSTITQRGFCWSTSLNPTTSDSTVTAAGTTGSYSATMTGLTVGTTYHMRAYATNAIGTSYGADTQFTTVYSALLGWFTA